MTDGTLFCVVQVYSESSQAPHPQSARCNSGGHHSWHVFVLGHESIQVKYAMNSVSWSGTGGVGCPTPLMGTAQSCPTLCNPMGYSLPGSSVHEILQARILEWVAISFSRARIRENRIGCLTSKGAPRPVHYQSVPRLCKAFLTARLFNCETFRDHCSSDLISNMHLKDLSFGIDEI